MTISKPWAAKGVALYPPSFCMVGQNQVFNALHQFRRSFWDGDSRDIAGFFVAFGDWGLGKTRLGYELVGEATGRIDQWLLNPNEHIIAPYHRADTKARVLEPALKDGILPLYVRYSSVCDDELDAATWVPRLAVEALKQTIEADPTAGGPSDLYEDLRSALHAKGVKLDHLDCVRDSTSNFDDRLTAAMQVLKKAGINHLWIIVDEVETPGDLKKGLREDTPTKVDDEYLLMVSEVIKHENWRGRHPYVNFLLLCSLGMRDQIHIGPNLRRASSVTLEPNQVTDVGNFVEHIKKSLADPEAVDYPVGTLEGAFLAANRNFGWLNVLMASIHETLARHRDRGETVEAWELLRDFARTDARANHIFNDSAVLPLIGSVAGVPKKEIERLIYGQLPVAVGGPSSGSITATMAEALLQHEIAGRGKAFAELAQIHIDERGLANELTRPEIGFKAKEGKTDTYYTPTCEISVVGLLEALRAFSVTVDKAKGGTAGDFVIYTDLEQWGEQLAALYPREGIDFAAEALHRIFLKPEYRVDGARFVGMSFRLWREFNKLLVSSAESVRFFKDGQHEASLEQYVQKNSDTKHRRASAVCLGLAKLIDERLDSTRQASGLKDIPHQIMTSQFVTPSMEGLRVTPDGRVTIVYCLDEEQTIDRLKSYVGLERVHPILVLFPATADISSFQERLEGLPTLKRCIIPRRLVSQEEDFLLKYSGRDTAFDPHVARLSKVANGLLKSYQDDWQAKTREWANTLRKTGYLLAPVWSRARGVNVTDFAKGYRHMLATNCSLDATHEDHGGPLNTVEFENCRQAAKKNVEPPAAWKHGDLLGVLTTDGSNLPRVPRCFFALLQELKTQSSASKLANNFFFLVPETEYKAVQQLEQILELLIGIGVVRKTGDLYRAVDQNLLESRRQSASNWLKNECKGLIKELEDLFPTQAGILLNAAYPAAGVKLEDAESKIKTIDFSLLNTPDLSSLSDESFRKFVGDILAVESLITAVCPLDIGEQSHQPFDCSPARIIAFENRFNSLSVWEKVSFLAWLKNTFLQERDSLLQEIEELLNEAAELAEAKGEPFPIAPVTLPLKAIQNELENTVKGPTGGSKTRMATIQVAEYTLLIDQYLVDSKYEAAWKRMEALRGLISKDKSQSFFARFKKLHSQWENVVEQFKSAESAWNALATFISDAPQSVTNSLSSLKGEIKKYEGLIRGGLKKQIQSQCDDVSEDQLLETLRTEVEATANAIQPLEQTIQTRLEAIHAELRGVIKENELRALNRVLKANGLPAKEEPSPATTYAKTKLAYESFNGEVISQGQSFFEGTGKKTHFDLWVEVCSGLIAGTYDEEKHPDHADAIKELKAMKLIRSRLELR